MVFTFVWALDDREDLKYVQDIIHIFTSEQHPIYFVELEAKLEVRLERNKTADRLAEKASKRNLVLSEQRLLRTDQKYIMNTTKANKYLARELLASLNYMKIENSVLSTVDVADQIIEYFHLL